MLLLGTASEGAAMRSERGVGRWSSGQRVAVEPPPAQTKSPINARLAGRVYALPVSAWVMYCA